MLSILIPLYNYNAYPLAKQIVAQALKLDIDFEFICIDDASGSPLNVENKKINALKNAKFIAQKTNAGYRGNRNNLAAMSKYNYLLFIDGDSIIIDGNYISNYVDNLSEKTDIIYGGRTHPKNIDDSNKKLRWKYGKYIEDKTAFTRNKNIYKTLMFNNTLIRKEWFNLIKFDTSMTKYGHDDTVFAYHVGKLKLHVKHINNPVQHGDIDSNDSFLNKTEEGIINLFHIYQTKKINFNFIRILKLYSVLEKTRLKFIVILVFKLLKTSIKIQLKSSNPSLFLFNFYKIGLLCTLKKNII
jgi:glycosyltransferase involved in cell wall biosynthesis